MLFKRIKTAKEGTVIKSSDSTHYLLFGFLFAGLMAVPGKYHQLHRIWNIFSLGFGLIYAPLGYMFALFFSAKLSTSAFLTVLQLSFNALSGVPRLIYLAAQNKRLLLANELLDKLDAHCISPRQKLGVRELVALGNRIFILFLAFYEGFVLSKLFIALLCGEPMVVLYNPWIHYDLDADRKIILLQTANDYAILQFGVLVVMLIDAYPTIYVTNLREHIKLLRLRVEELNEVLGAKQRYQQLINCVLDHQTMVKYCQLLRPLISITTVLQFLVCGSALGIAVINLLFFADFLGILGNFPYLIMIILQTFPLCYTCNCVKQEVDQLSDSIVHTNWMYESQNYKKILLFFLHNVQQQPMTFHALIFPIDLKTNITFSKFAFTVFTLAQNSMLGKANK